MNVSSEAYIKVVNHGMAIQDEGVQNRWSLEWLCIQNCEADEVYKNLDIEKCMVLVRRFYS